MSIQAKVVGVIFALTGATVAVLATPLLAEQQRIRQTGVYMSLVVLALGFLAALALSRSLARRLRTLAFATDAVARGTLEHPPVVDGSADEIGQLARSFNAMAANSRALVQEMSATAAAEEIRLERLVVERTAQLDSRTRDMRLVLKHVEQGLVMVDRAGVVSRERSTAAEVLLGARAGLLWDWVAATDTGFADSLRLGWEALADGAVPREAVLDQLPKLLRREERFLRFQYISIVADTALSNVLVIVTDVTADVMRERMSAESHETFVLFEQLVKDRRAVTVFCAEGNELVASLGGSALADRSTMRCALHTLKENSAMLGLESFSARCHALEHLIAETGSFVPETEALDLAEHWAAIIQRVAAFGEARVDSVVEANEQEFLALHRGLLAGLPRVDLARHLSDWRLEPVSRRLERFASEARRVADRLGRKVEVVVESSGARLDAVQWAPFWGAFVDVIRNAVDHGVETVAERQGAGKPAVATIMLRAYTVESDLVIQVSDDGRGVDWEAIAVQARRLGVPASSSAELAESLFVDGLSTRTATTEYSGRGVGLGAVRAACRALGGTAHVESRWREGTQLELRVPLRSEVRMRTGTPGVVRAVN